jgi:pimeloyl-ACP methyl ester carboxylesterase
MGEIRELVVYLPGIVGSRLDDPDSGRGRWSSRSAPRAWFDPSVLDFDRPLVPAGLMPDLAVVQSLPQVPRFRQLFRQLEGRLGATIVTVRPGVEPDPNADIVVVPYDFRQSIATAAEYLDRVVGDWRGDRPVIVVAHSMGGLVARYWISRLGGWQVCDRLLSLGTPFRGAPKALAWLTGVADVPNRIVETVRKWPSMYELLPRYEMIRVTGGELLRPHQLRLPGFDDEMAAAAYRLHEEMDQGWAGIDEDRRPQIFSMYSYGHATLGRADLRGDRLFLTKEDPEWHAENNPRPDGDATVPGLSAIPWELDTADHVEDHDLDPKGSRHMGMATTEAIVGKLAKYWNVPKQPVRGPDTPAVWLGLDLDDQYVSGQPIPIGARLRGANPDEASSMRVQIRAVSETGSPARVADPALKATEGAWWATTVDPLPPGIYHVQVSAARGPGHDNLICGDHIAVLPEDASR